MGARRAIILLGVAMAVLFLASALLSPEPSAQTTSPDGKIVYVKQGTEPSDNCDLQSGCDDLWVMDADGTNQTNLTDTPNRSDYQPAWAPSGAQLTFVREVEGQIIFEQPDIFVMDTDPATNDAINLTQTDESESHPDWSPDGAKIAFSGVRNSGWEIVTMDPDGQNEANLTGDGFEGNDEAPEWSPDGTKVVFQKESQVGGCCEPWEIWAVNRDGSGDTNLTNHPSYDMGPSWSPDGSEITFTSTRNRTEDDPSRADIFAMAAPTTLPPPSQSTAATTMGQGASDMAFAESTLSSGTACTLSGSSAAETLTGTSGADVICGLGGNDILRGLGGNDTLRGAGGNDTLQGGVGNDTLDGGTGTDTASYSASLTAVSASLATNTATGEGSDTFVAVENLLGSTKADTLTGSGATNRLTGGLGNDTERGGSGNDRVIGSGGANFLYGQGGDDTVNSKDGVSGNDTLSGGTGTDTKTTDATEKSVVGF